MRLSLQNVKLGFGIYTFKNRSINQADECLSLIFNHIQSIANHPELGENASKIRKGYFRKGYFRSKIKSYYIFYKIDSRNKNVEIIRILHERMDVKTRRSE